MRESMASVGRVLLAGALLGIPGVTGVNISGEVNRTINRVVDKAVAVSIETYVRQQGEEEDRKRRLGAMAQPKRIHYKKLVRG